MVITMKNRANWEKYLKCCRVLHLHVFICIHFSINVLSSCSNCCQCFSLKKNDNDYLELDDDTEDGVKDKPVSIFQLVSIFQIYLWKLLYSPYPSSQFKFANGLDLFLMLVSVCCIILHSLCTIANLFLIGRLTGLFAIESYGNNCQNQTSIHTKGHIYPYHQSFESAVFSAMHLPKWFVNKGFLFINHISDFFYFSLSGTHDVYLSSNFPIPITLFHKEVMRRIYLLFSKKNPCINSNLKNKWYSFILYSLVFGAIQCLAAFLEHFLWNYSVKRQIYRMNTALFRSLVQRVS